MLLQDNQSWTRENASWWHAASIVTMCTDCASGADWFSCCITSLASFPDHSHVQVWFAGNMDNWTAQSTSPLLTCMSLAMPHIPGDGRLDTLLDNELDPSACQLDICSILIILRHCQWTCNPVQCSMVCVLLTKLQHSCISQLGAIIIRFPRDVTWASPKCCGMYPALVHLEGSEGVPAPWLCTFRKSELGRGKTTDWWMQVQDTQWAYYCTIVQIQNLIRTHTCEFIANCGKTLPLPTSVDKSYSHPCHPVGIARETWPGHLSL